MPRPLRTAARLSGFVPCLLSTLACNPAPGGDRVSDGDAPTVTDSGGVRLVRYAEPNMEMAALEPARLEDSIVRVPRDSNAELFGLRAAAFAPTGALFVVQASTSEVLRFDSTLTFLGSSGRQGSGPGEYQLPVSAWPLATGGVSIYDFRLRRVTQVGPDGALAGVVNVQSVLPFDSSMTYSNVLAADADGRILVERFVAEPPRVGISRARIRRALVDGDAVVELQPEVAGLETYRAPPDAGGTVAMGLSPFARKPIVTLCGDRIVDADSHAFALTFRDRSSTVRQLVREARAATPIEARHIIVAMKASLPPGVEVEVSDEMVAAARRASTAQTLPVIETLLCDPTGGLWVIEASIPGDAWRAAHSALARWALKSCPTLRDCSLFVLKRVSEAVYFVFRQAECGCHHAPTGDGALHVAKNRHRSI